MKKFYYLPLALAALGLTACSSDDAVTPDGGKSIADLEGGYMTVSVNLPTATDTRATTNDNFDDGLATEYDVKNATLLLFEGSASDEANATFHSAYTLGTGFSMYGDNPNQITSTVQIAQEVSGTPSGDTFYALVILNKNSVLTTGENASNKDWQIAGTTLTKDTKFSDVQALTSTSTTVAAYNGTGFFMTNAPLSNVKGGETEPTGAKIQTLVPIDASKVYNTKAEAEANPAAEIYVERAVGKVTMSDKINEAASGTLADAPTDAEGTTYNVTATIQAWDLDITNKSTYVIHNYTGLDWSLFSKGVTTNPYRMVGHTPMSATDAQYRIYWGIDPNYDSNNTTPANDFEALTYGDASVSLTNATFGDDNPKYCLENTFDVADQTQDRTTRVIVKVKLSPAKYISDVTVNGTETYTDNASTSTISDFYLCNGKYYSQAGINALVKKTVQFSGVTVTSAVPSFDETGSVKAVAIDGAAAATGSTMPTDYEAQALAAVKGLKITYYKEGICYYPIRIKHFGDDLTPWNKWEKTDDKATDPASGTVSNIYPDDTEDGYTQADKYLGRYGVLRNNWYDISVNSIKAPGTPYIPTPGETPDDELNNYISFKINILSWAKRTQSADL